MTYLRLTLAATATKNTYAGVAEQGGRTRESKGGYGGGEGGTGTSKYIDVKKKTQPSSYLHHSPLPISRFYSLHHHLRLTIPTSVVEFEYLDIKETKHAEQKGYFKERKRKKKRREAKRCHHHHTSPSSSPCPPPTATTSSS